jgi:hypothetical protein
VNYSFALWSLAGLCASFNFLPVRAAEYCLRPGNQDGTQADSVVCCTTPAGWRGWKDDPRYPDRIKRLDPYSKGFFNRLVSFHLPNCKQGPECPYLSLKVTARDPRGQPNVERGLRNLLDEKEQPQDLSPRKPPCVVVSRFGSFHTENSGEMTIWQIRCPSGSQELVTLFAQRDVLVTIEFGAPDIREIVAKVDSLKELARSVRIADASLALPDIVEINAGRLSDEAIRQQLLQLTPVGTPMDNVYELLQWRLVKGGPQVIDPGETHWIGGDLQEQIDSYPNPGRFATVVEAFWRSDKQHKLRDVEIKRRVVEFKAIKAKPKNSK